MKTHFNRQQERQLIVCGDVPVVRLIPYLRHFLFTKNFKQLSQINTNKNQHISNHK